MSSLEDWQQAGFGIYIHWPFCQAKCPYCDFNSHVRAQIDQDAWKAAYLKELDKAAQDLPNRVVQSVFFGGGTPSLMAPSVVDTVLNRIHTLWPTSNSLEVSLEANPTSFEIEKFRAFHSAGVNRISLGIQALNDADLKRLGRLHSQAEAIDALTNAQSIFDRVSFDLIYARQNQSQSDWENELTSALTLQSGHLSLYQLTIEPNTRFGDLFKRGRLAGLPSSDQGADLYQITQDLCEAYGLPPYEVSNHAAPEHECHHNLIYWNSGDYLGIGPGAHGRLTLNGERIATQTSLNPEVWLNSVHTGASRKTEEILSSSDQAIEFLLMGLRTAQGISQKRLETIHPKLDMTAHLHDLIDLDLLEIKGDHLLCTRQGRPLLNAILDKLLN